MIEFVEPSIIKCQRKIIRRDIIQNTFLPGEQTLAPENKFSLENYYLIMDGTILFADAITRHYLFGWSDWKKGQSLNYET